MNTKIPGYVLVTAILTVGGLMAYALHLGHDGVLLSGSLFLIGALTGVSLPTLHATLKQASAPQRTPTRDDAQP